MSGRQQMGNRGRFCTRTRQHGTARPACMHDDEQRCCIRYVDIHMTDSLGTPKERLRSFSDLLLALADLGVHVTILVTLNLSRELS